MPVSNTTSSSRTRPPATPSILSAKASSILRRCRTGLQTCSSPLWHRSPDLCRSGGAGNLACSRLLAGFPQANDCPASALMPVLLVPSPPTRHDLLNPLRHITPRRIPVPPQPYRLPLPRQNLQL